VSDLGTILDLSWKLLLVLGLAVLAIRALRWLSNPQMAPDSVLKLVVRLPVGPQQSLLLVAVGKKRLLVGQSPQQLVFLSELAEEDLDDTHLSASSLAIPPRNWGPLDFRAMLKRSLNRDPPAANSTGSNG